MTYEDYLIRTCAKFQMGAEDVALILVNQAELIPDKDAEVDPRTAKHALCNEFATLLPLANISEGGFSVSWNTEAVKLWYSMTCKQLGLSDITKPKVKDRSNLW